MRVGTPRYYLHNPRHLWWAIENRRKGYKFSPIKRCLVCAHTTPSHYATCTRYPSVTSE
jgi:hypothetical protein